MTPVWLIAGITVSLLAVLVLVFFVVAPPAPRIAASRRTAPGTERTSVLRRVSAQAEEVVARGRRRLFGAEELELAGVKATPSQFTIYVASAASVLALFGAVIGLINGTSILLAILFAIAAPVIAKVVLVVRTDKRRAKFADQVDDTVQLISGGLRAGHGFSRTVAAVASEADAPMGEELTRVVNETRLGRDMPEALAVAAARMRSDDFDWVAQAVGINAETGGNLAEVLDQVGRTIRERNQIRRQVRALSAEGRLSGLVLILLPIVMFFLFSILQPNYLSFFFTNIVGIAALILSLILLVIGIIWIAAVVRVRF